MRLPADLAAAAARRSKAYDGDALRLTEEKREQARREQEKTYLVRLVDGPVLMIPLRKMNMQFDPRTLLPLGEHGTVYPSIRIVDVWGILEMKDGGALISADFSKITVPAPRETQGPKVKGDDWTLELNSGWALQPAQRAGSFTLEERDHAN